MNLLSKLSLVILTIIISYFGIFSYKFDLSMNASKFKSSQNRLIQSYFNKKCDINSSLINITNVYSKIVKMNSYFNEAVEKHQSSINVDINTEKNKMRMVQILIENMMEMENKGLNKLSYTEWDKLNHVVLEVKNLSMEVLSSLSYKENQEEETYKVSTRSMTSKGLMDNKNEYSFSQVSDRN